MQVLGIKGDLARLPPHGASPTCLDLRSGQGPAEPRVTRKSDVKLETPAWSETVSL
jgi:hypothetical protein